VQRKTNQFGSHHVQQVVMISDTTTLSAAEVSADIKSSLHVALRLLQDSNVKRE